MLDGAGSVELGVGGALVGGGEGAGDRDAVGDGGWGDVTIRVAPSNRLQAFDDKLGGFLYLLISGEASKAESYRSVALIRAESHGA